MVKYLGVHFLKKMCNMQFYKNRTIKKGPMFNKRTSFNRRLVYIRL